jgi:hypothetical protein
MKTENQVGISFGALCDPLTKQLDKQGWKYDTNQMARFEQQVNAIHTLRFADLLTDGMVDKVFVKINKKIVAHVAKENNKKIVK